MNRQANSVVHLSSVHSPYDTRILQKECRSLASAGFNVHLVAPHDRYEQIDGVQIVPIAKFPGRRERMTKGVKAAYEAARDLEADVYHFHDPELLLAGVWLKQRTRARVIYDVHENYSRRLGSRSWLPGPLKPVVPGMVGALEQLCARRVDSIVGATEHIAELFPKTKAIVVHNYPLLDLARPSPDQATYQADNKQLIYTGGWTDHRGIYQLVEAMAYVKEPAARLRLLGRLINPGLRDRAMELKGYRKLDYLGIVSFEQVYDEMRHSAVGLVCNQPGFDYDRAQPNKLFEYMSAGLPVIASHYPKWKEIVEGNGCGVTVDPTKPEAIAEAMDYLLSEPELRRQMGLRGQQAVASTYNWRVEGQKLIDLYHELLS